MTDLETYELELRKKIYGEIMNNNDIIKDAKELGPDAYLAASRVRWACAVVAMGVVK